MDANTGIAEQHKCTDDDTASIMTYSGTDPNECKITVKDVKDIYNCQWAARLDVDLSNTVINITVAHPIDNVTIEAAGNLVAGMDGKLVCKIFGGRPAPSIKFEFEDTKIKMVNDSLSQTPGKYRTFHYFAFNLLYFSEVNSIFLWALNILIYRK